MFVCPWKSTTTEFRSWPIQPLQEDASYPPVPPWSPSTRSTMATATTPIRKKRNYKGLNLDVSQPPPSPQPEPLPIPIASRAAPSPANAKGASAAGGAKKRPPGLTLGSKGPAKKAPAPQHDDGMLTLPGPSSAQGTGSASPFRSNYQSTLTQQLEALSLGQVALKAEDLREVGDLGSGNGGSVKKVLHVPTGTLMAKKVRRYSSVFGLRNATSCCLLLVASKLPVYFIRGDTATASNRPFMGPVLILPTHVQGDISALSSFIESCAACTD